MAGDRLPTVGMTSDDERVTKTDDERCGCGRESVNDSEPAPDLLPKWQPCPPVDNWIMAQKSCEHIGHQLNRLTSYLDK